MLVTDQDQQVDKDTPQQLIVFSFVFTGIAAFAVDFFRKYMWEIWTGWTFLAVGCGLFSVWDQSSSTAMTASFQVIAGLALAQYSAFLQSQCKPVLHLMTRGSQWE
jgi:hypothetical protein